MERPKPKIRPRVGTAPQKASPSRASNAADRGVRSDRSVRADRDSRRGVGRDEGGDGEPPAIYRDKDLTKFYGVQACHAIFKTRRHQISRVFIAPRVKDDFAEAIRWCESKGIPCKIAGDSEITKVAMTHHHEGACVEARPVRLRSFKEVLRECSDLPRCTIVYLDGVENPHNLGAAMRTCAFFGVDALLIESREIASLSGATCRVAEGAAEYLPVAVLRRNSPTIPDLQRAGFTVCATTPHEAENLFEISWPKKLVLLFGAEGPGLSEAKMSAADLRAVIPGRAGVVESLNVASAVAIFLGQVGVRPSAKATTKR